MTRRGVVLLVAAVAVLATTAGTGAFSAATVDRGLTVSVADDDSAYLGVALETNDTANLTVTITNQFPGDTELTDVAVTTSDTTATLATDSDPLTVGATATATFQNATCGDTVAITATGDGVTVTLERAIDCT